MATIVKQKRPMGMRAFTLIWCGQFASLLGTGMTRFVLTLWVWQETGQATALALMAFFGFAPGIILTPFAGAIVDRSNRKLMMMMSDLGAGFATLFMLALSLSGHLVIWHIYAASAFAAAAESFQFPAYSAAISTMVEKKHYARTSAMLALAGNASMIFAPILGAAFYAFIHLDGIFLIDICTLFFAVSLLALVYIPQPPPSAEGEASKGSLWSETLFGFRYIKQRPSLLGLQLVFFFGNFLAEIGFVLLAPMILARTSNDEAALATVMSAFGIGGVVGGLVLSAWGGPKRRVNGVLSGWLLAGLLEMTLLGLGRVMPVWAGCAFLGAMFSVLINSSNQAIWQSKVPPDVQGRVFAVRALIAQIVSPLSMLLAGPLADYVFEPAMADNGALAGAFGPLVGTGPGAGMALVLVLAGILTALVAVVGYLIPAIRHVESIIPDHQERMEQPFAPETETTA